MGEEIDNRTEAWLTWLADRSAGDGYTGYDAVGWEASTWVLHSIYEVPGSDPNITHDDLHRQAVENGRTPPAVVGSINLDKVSTVVGNSLGMTVVQPGWARLRWSALAERLSVDVGKSDRPPCHRWLPYRSWPASLIPPDEGSLDEESFRALVEVLAAHAPRGHSTSCVAYYSPLACVGVSNEVFMAGVQLGDVARLVDPEAGRAGTPSNLWPLDRTWMIYTDWDLWGTKVSGSRELIEAVLSVPQLECVSWAPAT